MSLNKQVHLYAIDTSAFYDEEEMAIHKQMLKLYQLRAKIKKRISKPRNKISEQWKIESVNRILKKRKNKLVEILNIKAQSTVVRQVRPEVIKNKNVISLFSSATVRALNLKINEITDDLMVVNVFFFQVFENIVKNGFEYNGEKYIFLCASAGQIRTKKALFIKQSSLDLISDTITCGLSINEINAKGGCNPNKYLAYLSLNNSATDEWEEFDIDKSIVVEDFETNVQGTVDFIDDKDYSITRKEMEVPVPHMDGAGMMLEEGTRMVRLPWVKGLLITFPFDRFIQEKCNGNGKINDIYGQEHDILAEGIRYIFTKSQFKMWKYYESWDDYKARFKKYHCKANYCNLEENYIPKSRINYQMLQSLTDMTDKEIDKLVKQSVEEINLIGYDYQTTMRLLGATDYNTNPSGMQRALKTYPELMRDVYNKDILKDVKKSLVKKAKSGKVKVNGGYRFLSPDLYAFCEWLFLGIENPQGLLQNGEVYCSGFWDGNELACLRSPHLYREWPIRVNKRNEEIDKWFGMTKCIYTSCHDLISKILMFDCDGDKALVVKDRNLIEVAKRNMVDIVPLYYDMKKAKPTNLNTDSIYQGMIAAYTGGNIGPISNNISKVWNSGEISEEQLNVIKWLCLINNEVIDYAKTLYRSTPPKQINKLIKSYTKAQVPNFFIYAKDKKDSQVELPNDSTMNKIAAKIPSSAVTYSKTLGKFDYRNLLSDKKFVIGEDKQSIVDVYDYWNEKQGTFYSHSNKDCRNDEDLFAYQEIRKNIIHDIGKPIDYIVDTLVSFLYKERKASNKKLLWACFSEEMNNNLEKNTDGKVCQICGKRFKPKANNNTSYCSSKCLEIANIQKTRQRMRDSR